MKRDRPKLWAVQCVVNFVERVGNKVDERQRFFTVAESRQEAAGIIGEGILGIPNIGGALIKPKKLRCFDGTKDPAHKALTLLANRYRFIVPYHRLGDEETALLVKSMMR